MALLVRMAPCSLRLWALQTASEPTGHRPPSTDAPQSARLNAVQEANLFKMLSIANQVAPGSCAPAQLTQHAAKTTQPMNQADLQNFGIMMATHRKQQQLRRQQPQQQPQQQQHPQQQQQHLLMPGQEYQISPGQRQVPANTLQRQQSQGTGVHTQGMALQSLESGQAAPSMRTAASFGASDFRQLQHPDKEAEFPMQRSEHPTQGGDHRHQRGDSAGKLACLGRY